MPPPIFEMQPTSRLAFAGVVRGPEQFDPERTAVQTGVYPLSHEDRASLTPSIGLKQLLDTPLSSDLTPAMSNFFDRFISTERKLQFRDSIASSQTIGDAITVLNTYGIPQKLVTEGKRILEIPLSESAKPALITAFKRYVAPDLQSIFEEDFMQATTLKDAMKVLIASEVPQTMAKQMGLDTLTFAEETAHKLKPAAPFIPLLLAACLRVPEIISSTPEVDLFGEFFRIQPERTILQLASIGATFGGILGFLTTIRPHLDAVFRPHNPIPMHAGAIGVLKHVLLEAFENYLKVGAAASGLALTAGGVPVENIRFIANLFFLGLGFQTLTEFVTEPLERLNTATAPPAEEHGGGHH